MTSYALGVDLGQATDHTAAALLEYDPGRERVYRLRGLHRFPLGTAFTDVPKALAERVLKTPLRDHVMIALDASGVGAPIVEHTRNHLKTVPIYGITITAGNTVTGSHTNPNLPKRDLISTASLILEQRRLRIADTMDNVEQLLEELLAFRRTVSEHGRDTYAAAAGGHDDLVLALSLALWLAENRRPAEPRRGTVSVPRGRIPGVDDPLTTLFGV